MQQKNVVYLVAYNTRCICNFLDIVVYELYKGHFF